MSTRRAKRPLNDAAVQAADDEIYRRHANDPRPNALYDANGNRLPLSATDPAQTDLRREWMDLYIANGGEIEGGSGGGGTTPVTPCPDRPGSDPDPTPGGPPTPTPTPTEPGHIPSETANLGVRLVHACDQSPLEGGTVRISGPETREGRTGPDGWAHFEGITPGSYLIEAVHSQHHPGTGSVSVPALMSTTTELPLQGMIRIAPIQVTYTVVLDANGNASAAHPILKFNITNGPPNHFIDVQLSRTGAASLSGGPGLAGSWVHADGRDARKDRQEFSSWSNNQRAIQLDGGGNATFEMPLEWWRDQVRRPLAGFTEFTYHYRVVAMRNAATAVCAHSSADGSASGSVRLLNNLTAFRVVDLGYIDSGTKMSMRMEFEVREANTTDMYTFVQWKIGGREIWSSATPSVMSRPNVQDYNVIHVSDYPESQIDRLGTNPRYWDGVYTITNGGKKAAATDKPGSTATSAAEPNTFTHIDFDTRVHLNFEVPAAVTISRQDGAAPVFGVVIGVLADPQPITLDSDDWNSRILRARQADGTEVVTHPAAYAGP
ncbi:MAG: hypothetical protein ACKV2U_13855 [Bryobacteraceae bacterium]